MSGGKARRLKRVRTSHGKGGSKKSGGSKGGKSGKGGAAKESSKWSKGGKSSGGKGSGSITKRGKESGGVGEKSSKSLSKICKNLDFGEFYDGGLHNQHSSSKQKGSGGYYLVNNGKAGKSGKAGKAEKTGKAEKAGKSGYHKRRRLDETNGRSLQFEGERCSPNAFDVASNDPELSIFVELIEAANLQDIFLCAGMSH